MSHAAPQGDGGRTFFWLAALILGGLLFASGVMVGRGMSPGPASVDTDPLASIDRRDSDPVVRDGGKLLFPEILGEPPTRAPVDRAGQDLAGAGTFCVQVASFRQQEQAEQLVARLEADGLPEVRLVPGDVPGKGVYYRVRLGRFADRESAERFLSARGIEGLVIQGEG